MAPNPSVTLPRALLEALLASATLLVQQELRECVEAGRYAGSGTRARDWRTLMSPAARDLGDLISRFVPEFWAEAEALARLPATETTPTGETHADS